MKFPSSIPATLIVLAVLFSNGSSVAQIDTETNYGAVIEDLITNSEIGYVGTCDNGKTKHTFYTMNGEASLDIIETDSGGIFFHFIENVEDGTTIQHYQWRSASHTNTPTKMLFETWKAGLSIAAPSVFIFLTAGINLDCY